MPIRLPQGNIAIADLICERITFNGDGSVISGLDPFTPTRIVLPLADTPLLPALGYGDGDSGFFESVDDTLKITLGGTARWQWTGNEFRSEIVNGPSLLNEAASATNPTVAPDQGDLDTGIGQTGADQLSLIAGGVQVANLTEAAGVVQMILPLQNLEATPSIAFGTGNTGFFQNVANRIGVSTAGVRRWTFTGNVLESVLAGAQIRDEAASDAIATLIPNRFDTNTGIGWRNTDIGVLIAGGENCMEFGEAGAAPLVAFYGTAAIALQTGVAVSSAGIHAALVNLGLITA